MSRSIAIRSAAVALAFVIVGGAGASADDKSLQNVKGSVSYEAPDKAPIAINVNATVALTDMDYAITAADSLAQVIMPDSSRVLVGSDSKVQLAFFKQEQIANAKFVVYNGRVRFAVRHPQGAKANYTFTTSVGTIGVRGTQGDIGFDPDGSLRVNVYELCDATLPVQVTTKDGKSFTLSAGQSLLAKLVNGIVQAEVGQLTQGLIDQFSPEFGVPTSWDQATGEVVSRAQGAASTAVNNVTGGLGGQEIPNLGGLFGKKKATPSPQPSQSTCS